MERTFHRRLNLWDSTAMVVGSMIGSGIFIVSADIARYVQSPALLLLVWVLAGVMTVVAALIYGELSSIMPHVGGQYIYLREAYGPLFGFLYGWALFLVIQTGNIAAVAMAFAKFTGVLIPAVSERNIVFSVGYINVSVTHLVAVGSIILLTLINIKGIQEGKIIQNVFTILKTAAVFLLIIIGLFFVSNTQAVQTNINGFWDFRIFSDGVWINPGWLQLVTNIGTAMVGALFALDAWYNVTFASDEVINPRKNLPKSLVFGTIFVGLLYVLSNIVYLRCLPLRGDVNALDVIDRGIQFAVDDRVGTAAMFGILGQYAAVVMAVVIVISTFGCNNGIVLSGARVYYSMAQDGLFFKSIGRLNRNGVPENALIFQGIWSIALCFSGSYSQLLDYVIFVVLLFLVLTSLSIFKFRKTIPDEQRLFKMWGFPYLPVFFMICALTVMVILLIKKPLFTWPGLGIVVIGIPVYYVWVNRGRLLRWLGLNKNMVKN